MSMENDPSSYEPGIDQNQGVTGTMARNQQHGDTEAAGTQEAGLDPNLVINQADDNQATTDSAPDTDAIGEQNYVNDEGTD